MAHEIIIIGISGASASGKSLLSKMIVQEVGSDKVVIIAEDSYYKDQKHMPFEERLKTNYDHPDAFDHCLLLEHLQMLRRGESISLPIYDYSQHCRSDKTRTISKAHIVVLEGIMLFVDPKLREAMDIRLFVDTPLDICLLRRLKRDLLERGRTIDSILTQYEQTVRPMYMQFIEPAKRHADLIIPEGGENKIAIDMITAKVNDLLEKII